MPEIWDGICSFFIGIHSSTLLWVQSLDTLGPAYNEFGHSEHPAKTSRFLCINIIDCNVIKFVYNEHPLITSSFSCIFLLVVSGTQYNGCWTQYNGCWTQYNGCWTSVLLDIFHASRRNVSFMLQVQKTLNCCGFENQDFLLSDPSGMGHPACEAVSLFLHSLASKIASKTRMHSNRMRTARSLSADRSLSYGGGFSLSRGFSVRGGVCQGGPLPPCTNKRL